MWAERSLAAVWRSVASGHLQTEACLEAALVAALEHPEVFARLAAHLEWKVPAGQPQITTQDVVASGRTDVTLTWQAAAGSSPRRIVLELKVDAPPDTAQIEKYLRDGADVIAIARFTRPSTASVRVGGRFLGTTTWRRIRALTWIGGQPPLPLLQLYELLDATRVIMPNVSLPGLMGMSSSWLIWTIFREWSLRAAQIAVDDFAAAGFKCVTREGARGRIGFEEAHERYVARLWPPPIRGDWLKVYVGLFAGRPGDPTLVEGVPDFFFALHVDPGMSFGQQALGDAGFGVAATTWHNRAGTGVLREVRLGTWEVLRARSSALQLVQAADQEAAFLAWMRERVAEWITDGVMAAVARLDIATRATAGAPADTDDNN